LQQGNKTLVPLADEFAFAQQYMALLAQRFPASFQLQIQVEPEQQTNYQLVPCCLQLLLENAVKHNVASAAQPLLIQLELQQNQLIVRHPLRPKAFAQPGTGTGLANLSERCLALLGKPIAVIQNDEFVVKVPLQHSV
jgi:LytS/YehU family sensor histidine kinase